MCQLDFTVPQLVSMLGLNGTNQVSMDWFKGKSTGKLCAFLNIKWDLFI